MTVREVVGDGPAEVGQARGPGASTAFYVNCPDCAKARRPMTGLTYDGAIQTAVAHNEAHARGEYQ